jgi:hypothetical protein
MDYFYEDLKNSQQQQQQQVVGGVDDDLYDQEEGVTEVDASILSEMVGNWLTLNDEINRLQQAMVERKRNKKVLNENIIKFMKNKEINNIDMKQRGGRLSLSTTEHTRALNQKYIQDTIQKTLGSFGQHTLADSLKKELLENRPKYTRERLKFHSKTK